MQALRPRASSSPRKGSPTRVCLPQLKPALHPTAILKAAASSKPSHLHRVCLVVVALHDLPKASLAEHRQHLVAVGDVVVGRDHVVPALVVKTVVVLPWRCAGTSPSVSPGTHAQKVARGIGRGSPRTIIWPCKPPASASACCRDRHRSPAPTSRQPPCLRRRLPNYQPSAAPVQPGRAIAGTAILPSFHCPSAEGRVAFLFCRRAQGSAHESPPPPKQPNSLPVLHALPSPHLPIPGPTPRQSQGLHLPRASP